MKNKHPIKLIRTQLNLSQGELANLINYTPGSVSHWETGIRGCPKEAILEIAYRFKYDNDSLFEEIRGWEEENRKRIAKKVELKVQLAAL